MGKMFQRYFSFETGEMAINNKPSRNCSRKRKTYEERKKIAKRTDDELLKLQRCVVTRSSIP